MKTLSFSLVTMVPKEVHFRVQIPDDWDGDVDYVKIEDVWEGLVQQFSGEEIFEYMNSSEYEEFEAALAEKYREISHKEKS